MSITSKVQIPWGRRLLPTIVDEVAETNPSRPFATIALTANVANGFRDVTFKEIANGVDSMAYFLQERFGKSQNFETLCYLGSPDLRTPILFYAAIKCGFKVLSASSPSLRSSH